jgi:cell division inhibitor SulA
MQQNQLALSNNDQQPADSNLIEITLPGELRFHLSLILPILNQLTYESGPGWLTYVGTALLAKKDCRRFGLNWQRLLQVLPSARCNALDIAERALNSGRSHTVVVTATSCDAQQLQRLENAARDGKCRCILIRAR